RLQFPVKPAFALTINKSQRQSLNIVHQRESHPTKVTVRIRNDTREIISKVLKPVDGEFICPICNVRGIGSRTGVLGHTKNHLEAGATRAGYECSICFDIFKTAKELDQHYETHSEPKEVVDDDLTVDDTKNAESLKQAKIELDLTTKNTHHSDCLLSITAPFKVNHASGATSLALLTQMAAKRAASDPTIGLDPIKKPRTQTYGEPADLEIILAINQFGAIINITDYKPLETSFFLQDYRASKSEIAQKLAGAMIHTGSQALLILKAEVYYIDS
ncbi:hypothetical protein BGX27_005228, partial [Mortierella sp. AM989]